MKIMRLHFIVILHLLGIIQIYAQQSVSKNAIEQLESFVVNMNNFNRQYPQEKVYLHLDNTGYFMGETIWFKAYVVRADKTKLTDISSVLYVELVDPTGEIVSTQKVKITNGTGAGYMILRNFLNSGFYEITRRAARLTFLPKVLLKTERYCYTNFKQHDHEDF